MTEHSPSPVTSAPQPPKLYPAQIRFMALKGLHIETFVPPSPSINIQEIPLHYTSTHSPYVKDSHQIQVGIRVDMGGNGGQESDANKYPFYLFVELVAEFAIDESLLPSDRVEEWAKINAPFILFPYVREHLFSLTARAGFSPLVLPLVEVPTFKIEKPSG